MEALQVPEEEQGAGGMAQLVARLNRKSVEKRYEAYRDIDWDAPQHRIDPTDPVWELPVLHPIGQTAWYRAQPPEVRARIGLAMVGHFMKVGVHFENVLTRGLLGFALRQPNGSPLFRYAYHEAIEESQHSLMFQEFLNRAGVDAESLGGWRRAAGERVVRLATRFPELFFVFVLGGEDPIDHAQRAALASGREIHPLLRLISQIHITEEARHLAFARAYLREQVPRLSPARRRAIAVVAPIVLAVMARAMLDPPARLLASHGVPPEVVRDAYRDNAAHREASEASLAKVHALLSELGVRDERPLRAGRLLARGLGLR